MANNTFTYQDIIYTYNDTFSYCKAGDTRIKKAELEAVLEAYQATQTPAEESKTKTHPTADACLAKIPETFNYKVNNKGHILIKDENGTTICRIRPLKDGMYIFPGKTLKATRTDWEFHAGWANEYALKVATWEEVEQVLTPKADESTPESDEPVEIVSTTVEA